MKVRIFSTQFEIQTVFKISHRLDTLIEDEVNSFFNLAKFVTTEDFNLLDLDISARELKSYAYLIGEVRYIKQEKAKYQNIYLAADKLINMQGYLLHPKKGDFILKKDLYRTFPFEYYIDAVIKATSDVLHYSKLESTIKGLTETVIRNRDYYEFVNEDVMHLEFLLSDEGILWLETEEGRNFRNSDAFALWETPLKKYCLNSFGRVDFTVV